MSTWCCKCDEVGVTPQTAHLKLDQFFFSESYPYSHGVSVCPPVCWQPATLKLPYTWRYLRVGNSCPFFENRAFYKLDLGSILEIRTSNNRQNRGILRMACSSANSNRQVSFSCSQMLYFLGDCHCVEFVVFGNVPTLCNYGIQSKTFVPWEKEVGCTEGKLSRKRTQQKGN